MEKRNRNGTARGFVILVARLTARQYKRIFSLCHYFAIMKPVQRNESRHLRQNEMAGLKGKSGPPGNMNAFSMGLRLFRNGARKASPPSTRKASGGRF